MRPSVLLIICATVLGLGIPYSVNAAEQFAICGQDNVGCQGVYMSCADLGQGTNQSTGALVQAKANQVCQQKGYSSGGVQPVTNSSGGKCGIYKFIVTCR
jgi:hypothetical protein